MQENKASRAFLVAAVVLGVMATVLSFAYLQNNSAKEAAPLIKILAASHDLRVGSAIDPEKDLREMEIDSKGVMADRVVLLSEASRYKGMHINRDILAGTPVWHADFVAPSMDVAGSWRALTIPTRGGSAQLLDPDDYVKIMVTRPLSHPRTDAAGGSTSGNASQSQWETVIITPNPLKVLAVGARTTRRYSYYASGTTSESNQSVTVEVTEDQAKDILDQTGGGQSTITLLKCPTPTATTTAPVN